MFSAVTPVGIIYPPPAAEQEDQENHMPRLVLGSRNKKKLREMVELLGDLDLELSDLSPWPDAPPARKREPMWTIAGDAAMAPAAR